MRVALVAALVLPAACGGEAKAPDPGLVAIALDSVTPDFMLPGSRVEVVGQSFVSEEWGEGALVLTRGGATARVTLHFTSYSEMWGTLEEEAFVELEAGSGEIWQAVVEFRSKVDGELYVSPAIELTLGAARTLRPAVDDITADGVIFVNDRIVMSGSGFLLDPGEGDMVVTVTGCFVPEGGGSCEDLPVSEFSVFGKDRTSASFVFSPAIAGILPGQFQGTIALENRFQNEALSATPRVVEYTLAKPAVFSTSTSVSLGSYLYVDGGGFVAPSEDASTLLEVDGTLGGQDVELTLVAEFVEGRKIRYVVNEDEGFGPIFDLRHATGTLTGTMRPVVNYGGDSIEGETVPVDIDFTRVRQIVHVQFTEEYIETLRDFGLRTAQDLLEQRILDVLQRDYATLNVDFVLEPPTSHALYTSVEIKGVDPNGQGLFGYDNSHGKDSGNERLHDRIGGVNALTQQDGYPGYGGVFIRSFFGFSFHPGSLADTLTGASELFDAIFDPLRPDLDGQPISAAELAGLSLPTSAPSCPGDSRTTQIECAIWTLGTLIGTSTSHELGHSMGLANPFGEGFHNPGDAPGRIMDAGEYRDFLERSELGQGPISRFCAEEYTYLREILADDGPADTSERPICD